MIGIDAKDIPPSKSIYNRALIVQSFQPLLGVLCESEFESEDVLHLKKALEDIKESKNTFSCGAGAAPLRFLAIRLSREKGTFTLEGSERLMARPQGDLLETLAKLGCQNIQLGAKSLSFESSGEWPEQLSLHLDKTSQVFSAVLLSSWNLEKNLVIDIIGEHGVSRSYAEMTLNLMQQCGWQGEVQKGKILLPKGQLPAEGDLFIEGDMSCVAAIAILGAIKDGVRFWQFPQSSLQGDAIIWELLATMGFRVVRSPVESLPGYENVRVESAKKYQGLEVDLKSTPDLFPVLVALCSGAQSPSLLKSLAALNSKESRRLDQMVNLLTNLGVSCEQIGEDLRVRPPAALSKKEILFDPMEDHRLAMAAATLNLLGANLKIKTPEVVQKSFPNYWQIVKQF